MATHSTLSSLFTAIANAIRGKTGGTNTIVADNFPTEIGKIVTLSTGTADATATAADILTGKTAYAKGAKVTGTAEAGAKVASGTWNSTTSGSNASSLTISDLTFTPKKIWVYSAKTASSGVIAIMADIENSVGYIYTLTSRNNAVFNSNSGTTNYRINVYEDNSVKFSVSSGFRYDCGTYTWYAIG